MANSHYTNTSYQDLPNDLDDNREPAIGWMVLDILNDVYIPVIIAVGMLGNLLSIVLFLSAPLRSRSSSFYLAALAGADFSFLFTLFLVYLSKHDIDLYNRQGLCQLLTFVSSVSNCMSVWVIVCSTFDRFIVVRFPLQRPRLCTVQNAKKTVLLLLAGSLLSHTYLLVMAGVQVRDDQVQCNLNAKYAMTMRVINVLDTCFIFLIPVVLIVAMNASIAIQLCRFYKTYRGVAPPAVHETSATAATGGTSTVDCGSGQHCSATRAIVYPLHMDGRALRMAPCRMTSPRTKHNVTKMLLVVSVVFFALQMPMYVIRLYSHWAATVSDGVLLLQQFSMLLFYTNFSVNFLLYSIYGVAFREALRTLLHERWKRMPFCGTERSRDDEQLNDKKAIPLRSRTV